MKNGNAAQWIRDDWVFVQSFWVSDDAKNERKRESEKQKNEEKK